MGGMRHHRGTASPEHDVVQRTPQGDGDSARRSGAERSDGRVAVVRLRIARTRQRCQLAPWKQRSITFTKPAWASEITSRTPARPRSTRVVTNPRQSVSFSESPTSDAEDLTLSCTTHTSARWSVTCRSAGSTEHRIYFGPPKDQSTHPVTARALVCEALAALGLSLARDSLTSPSSSLSSIQDGIAGSAPSFVRRHGGGSSCPRDAR